MFSLKEIYRQNRLTFYNFSTQEQSDLRAQYFFKTMLALSSACVFSMISKDLVNVVITIYAILLGFSFNVLFYLLSTGKMVFDERKSSLETAIVSDKVNCIGRELFYNVSYFNIIATLVIMMGLVYFLFDSRFPGLISYLPEAALTPYLIYARKFLLWLYRGVFYFFVFESLYTFLRTIGRVNFYFQQKIKLQESEREGAI